MSLIFKVKSTKKIISKDLGSYNEQKMLKHSCKVSKLTKYQHASDLALAHTYCRVKYTSIRDKNMKNQAQSAKICNKILFIQTLANNGLGWIPSL